MSKARLLMAAAVSVVPWNALRILLYRNLLGYEIGPSCRIGLLTIIACRKFSLGEGSTIRSRNLFKGSFSLRAGPRLFVGERNVFICPWAAREDMNYRRTITFGENCLVNEGHYVDIHGDIRIGDGTWLAGRASQFFTHGVGVENRDISIGAGCFVGSAVRFAPGSGIGSRNIVGIGSVVLKRIEGDEMLISGFPAATVRSISTELARGKYQFSKLDWG